MTVTDLLQQQLRPLLLIKILELELCPIYEKISYKNNFKAKGR